MSTSASPCAWEAPTDRLRGERPVGCRKALGSAVPRGKHECTPGASPAGRAQHLGVHTHGPGSGGRDGAPGWLVGAAAGARGCEAGAGTSEASTPGPRLGETAAARRPTQACRPRPRFSQPRRRCQGDRRRRFPRRAPPPGQSDRRSPEPGFSLFRSHFRPRTGGSAASAERPERRRPLGWCGTG